MKGQNRTQREVQRMGTFNFSFVFVQSFAQTPNKVVVFYFSTFRMPVFFLYV